ncbi:MAG: pyridoxamine 5'-phosphate oxidase, partial [Okeania sp. SIO2D1]|nr:pyridoxamine 5'-phosphate oxidase [Okeania sp. SIO2D1]
MDIGDFRREYTQRGLKRGDLAGDPFQQFEQWFQQAVAVDLLDPNAMILATATATAEPSLRTVLLKYFDYQGFVFFTNYESRKARRLS